ncbi:MAG: bifunctional diaminohydroxyphosphoribosylaminopyrimidine deaminase/5-amino-6-(5-phosphoribosylamino)uracil reductase RibD, partial [Rickettsiales bacterium]|nr:bifunctional diaminohydroxyphosphoribosylaminopyrimidine deaminase/5-amino-6-(5-phosphoribosylamino)uracil reductase RibD [Rickettsiales bacterium]
NGNGIAALRASGIEVIEDVCRDEAYSVNQGFFLTHTDKRPLISLKVATSLDGKIATHSGNSQWITGETARHFGHLLRSNHDAIAVGSGTVLADNPNLTCRLPGLEDASPKRIVFDRRLRMSLEHQIMKTASEIPTLIVTRKKDAAILHDAVSAIVTGPSTSLKDIMASLVEHGITRMLIEGGGQLAASFLKEGLIDHIYWIQAPMIIGGDGLDAVASLNIDQLDQCSNFALKESRPLGKDMMHHYCATP